MPSDMTQIKFTIESDIVAVFRARCASEGVSMASAARQWMKSCQPAKIVKPKTLTRPQRRKTVADMIVQLGGIMNAEASYLDSIPEQFEQRREAAGHACERFAEAIECLEDAYY